MPKTKRGRVARRGRGAPEPTVAGPSGNVAEPGPSGLGVVRSNHGASGRCRPRRSLSPLGDEEITNILYDSGSDDEGEDYFLPVPDEMEEVQLRRENVYEREEWVEQQPVRVHELGEVDEVVEDVEEHEEVNVSTVFDWSEDYSSFSGQQETYRRDPGPTFASSDPVTIFLQFWDFQFMETMARETNRYAEQSLIQSRNQDIPPRKRSHSVPWSDVSVEELYRYFALLIHMSFCHRTSLQEYWMTGRLQMSEFKRVMTRARFLLITKYLHFVNNENLGRATGHARKIEKVRPVLDHCNRVFSSLYTPTQHLSLDESLLLCKGLLSGRQYIRTKAARFGIKSFEICEAETGYLLRTHLYTGKDHAMHPEPVHGFSNHTAKVVLLLMDGFLDAGHVLVMDNWYNQLSLTRYLKSRHTDVLGTMSRARRGVPQILKDLMPNRMTRGEVVTRQCGDIALVAWKDVKLVTALSTYHSHVMVPGTRAGRDCPKPIAIDEYNRYMGGVDLKDQKLSMFLVERKRGRKWYMKVFKRLFNTSLLNAFIIYTRNPLNRLYTHREYRYRVAEGLLDLFPREELPLRPTNPRHTSELARLQPGSHFPVNTAPDVAAGGTRRFQSLPCVRCKALKKRTRVNTQCDLCKVPLCIGMCWKDYHTVVNLSNLPAAAPV